MFPSCASHSDVVASLPRSKGRNKKPLLRRARVGKSGDDTKLPVCMQSTGRHHRARSIQSLLVGCFNLPAPLKKKNPGAEELGEPRHRQKSQLIHQTPSKLSTPGHRRFVMLRSNHVRLGAALLDAETIQLCCCC